MREQRCDATTMRAVLPIQLTCCGRIVLDHGAKKAQRRLLTAEGMKSSLDLFVTLPRHRHRRPRHRPGNRSRSPLRLGTASQPQATKYKCPWYPNKASQSISLSFPYRSIDNIHTTRAIAEPHKTFEHIVTVCLRAAHGDHSNSRRRRRRSGSGK